MPIGINTNVSAMNAATQLMRTQASQAVSTARLSSGLRINSAKDDAAGLAIATRMESQIRGMNTAIRNANDGISLGQTAEGVLNVVQDNLQRMREIGVQSKSGALTSQDRGQLDKEFQQLSLEVKRSVDAANFNGLKMFDGTQTSFTIQVGAGTTANDTIDITTSDLTTLGGYDGLDVTTATTSQAAIDALDTDLENVNTMRSTMGAYQTRFESVIAGLTNSVTNLEASKGRITDADFAKETMNLTRSQILAQAGTSMLSQANQQPSSVLKLISG